MAVEIKYVVVRKSEEKMTFASKKEADAYDKMLDMAEVFSDWLATAPLTLEETQCEQLGMFLAGNKEAVQHILRSSKMPEDSDSATTEATTSEVLDDSALTEALVQDLSAESGEVNRHQVEKNTKAKSSSRAVKAA